MLLQSRKDESAQKIRTDAQLPPAGFFLQFLRRFGGCERVDHSADIAVEKASEGVKGKPDAEIGHAPLRIVLGSDAFASVACSDLPAAVGGNPVVAFPQSAVVKDRP